jgi:hypothetical protein
MAAVTLQSGGEVVKYRGKGSTFWCSGNLTGGHFERDFETGKIGNELARIGRVPRSRW